MLGGVQTQCLQRVFGREARYLALTNDGAPRSCQQIVYFEIDAIELRQHRPLQFDQILSRGTVKGTFVSGPQPQSLDRRRLLLRRAISNLRQSLLGSFEI